MFLPAGSQEPHHPKALHSALLRCHKGKELWVWGEASHTASLEVPSYRQGRDFHATSPRSPAPLVQGPTPSADSRAGLACTIRAITANYSSARRGTPKSRGDGPRKATGQPVAPAGAATSGQKGEESKTQVGAQGNTSPLISIAKSGGIQVNKARQGPGALWP